MPYATVRNVAINYQIVGDDGPLLALNTGGRRGHEEFIPLARRIAPLGFRVLLHDRRNTGASEILIVGDEGEEQIWADDLHALLLQLGLTPCFVGGSSAGARLSILVALRHPDAVAGLLLLRVTGGAFAAARLPDTYYGQFIRAAESGGMAALCETEQYRERFRANPANRPRLLAMNAQEYIRVMSNWQRIFMHHNDQPVMGVTPDQLANIVLPTLVIPGNDQTHSSASGRAAQQLIPGAELHDLGLADQDLPLVPFEAWAPHEAEIAQAFTGFMRRVLANNRQA
jgi:pimeloyl-ACP methyl ester carboxylesterase